FHLNFRRQLLVKMSFTDQYVFITWHNISAPGFNKPKDTPPKAGEKQQGRETKNDQKGYEALHFANIIAKM
ncbi:MAG: hypothetical protein WCL06_10630, partial [Bacteroidota bacterium]